MRSDREAQLLTGSLYRVDDRHVPAMFQILFSRFSFLLFLNFINTGQTDTDISPGLPVVNLEND
jgi:hypothetical protein